MKLSNSNIWISVFFLSINAINGCPYLDGEGENGGSPPHPRNFRMVERMMQSSCNFVGTTSNDAIDSAKEDIVSELNIDRSLGPAMIRLAFHDCIGENGCDGSVNMTNPGNSGLDVAIDALEEISICYQEFLTRADVWALASLTSAEVLQRGISGGPSFELISIGRPSATDPKKGGPEEPPSNHLTTDELLGFFESEFGFSAKETVAIMGVHSVGFLRSVKSGDRTPLWLNNGYYQTLLDPNLDEAAIFSQIELNGQFLWTRSISLGLRMLNSDIAIISDLTGYLNQENGRVEDCVPQNTQGLLRQSTTPTQCPVAPTFSFAQEYAQSQDDWLVDFRDAMVKMLDKSEGQLQVVQEASIQENSSNRERWTDFFSGNFLP